MKLAAFGTVEGGQIRDIYKALLNENRFLKRSSRPTQN
jgi:hypothetical protein